MSVYQYLILTFKSSIVPAVWYRLVSACLSLSNLPPLLVFWSMVSMSSGRHWSVMTVMLGGAGQWLGDSSEEETADTATWWRDLVSVGCPLGPCWMANPLLRDFGESGGYDMPRIGLSGELWLWPVLLDESSSAPEHISTDNVFGDRSLWGVKRLSQRLILEEKTT